MVLILSIKNDISTFNVVDWLFCQNKEFKIIYPDKGVELDKLYLSQSEKIINVISSGKDIPVTSYWYRRGCLPIKTCIKKRKTAHLKTEIKLNLLQEIEILSLSIQEFIDQGNNSIGDYKLTRDINKISVLKSASDVGLLIPDTIITTQKKHLVAFYTQHNKKIITKPISETLIINENDNQYYFYTSKIENLSEIPNVFFPSLFQEMIDKKYELRIFYLNNKCYSSAIFSQNDSCTSVDFRNYNKIKPNRYVPFKIPNSIDRKINKLMNVLNFNTGSIDMIVSTTGKFYFLEVNPIGQYGMISSPCNYYLDKIISDFLI